MVTDLRMETPLAGFDIVQAATRLSPQPVTIILTAFPVPTDQWQRSGADALLVKGTETLALPKRLKAVLQQESATAAMPRTRLFAAR